MRQLQVLAVAVLACVAYAMQAKAGTGAPCPIDECRSIGCGAGPVPDLSKDTEPAS